MSHFNMLLYLRFFNDINIVKIMNHYIFTMDFSYYSEGTSLNVMK